MPGYRAVMPELSRAPVVLEYASLFGGPARVRAGKPRGLDLFVLDAPHLYDRDGGPYADRRGQDFPTTRSASPRCAAPPPMSRGVPLRISFPTSCIATTGRRDSRRRTCTTRSARGRAR